MAQYDVYRRRGYSGYLLNVQSDFLDDMKTRIVVPLLYPDDAPKPVRFLNPTFVIAGEELIMVTQFVSAVSVVDLGEQAARLYHARDQITRALDRAFGDF